jgi:hypothetical protein
MNDTAEKIALADIERAESWLRVAMAASCNCYHEANTSPQPETHTDTCRYKVLYMAADALAEARAALQTGGE